MATQPEFSIVIPCFNERDAIEDTVRELLALPDVSATGQIIVVDDGSSDGTADILDTLAGELANLLVVRHDRNRGYGAALKTGVRRATGELIVITDADGTYPNHRIPDLLKEAQNADMVVGARTGENVTYSTLRKIPKVFLAAYTSWIANRRIPDINSGLRVFRKDIAEKFLHVLPNTFSFTTTITLAMMTNDYHVVYTPIDYSARIGKSKIRPIRDTLRFLQLIIRTGIYFAPLRTFAPFIAIMTAAFLFSLGYDITVKEDITDTTIVTALFTLNTTMFALLADMIDKRTGR